jgi:hypothetical protein
MEILESELATKNEKLKSNLEKLTHLSSNSAIVAGPSSSSARKQLVHSVDDTKKRKLSSESLLVEPSAAIFVSNEANSSTPTGSHAPFQEAPDSNAHEIHNGNRKSNLKENSADTAPPAIKHTDRQGSANNPINIDDCGDDLGEESIHGNAKVRRARTKKALAARSNLRYNLRKRSAN